MNINLLSWGSRFPRFVERGTGTGVLKNHLHTTLIHDFSVLIQTGSNLPDIKQILSHTEKSFLFGFIEFLLGFVSLQVYISIKK